MVNAIVDLIQSFIGGSFDTLKGLLQNMANMVFYIEKELALASDGLQGFDFNNIFRVVYVFASLLLIMIFIKKLIETYFFWQSGDPDTNPVQVVVRFIKAIVIMICFGWCYDIFITIMNEFLTALSNGIVAPNQDIGTLLQSQMQGGIFTAIACLFMLILLLSIIFQFITRGLEMLILRIAIPLACIGLINSDGGAFTGYIKKFMQNTFTVIIQVILVQLAILLMANGQMIYAIATGLVATRTPAMLNEFMISSSAGKIMPKVSSGARTITHLVRRHK
ncbi:MAG: hypothetical protein J6I85_03320 [Clostridia bacterium]|nr:hypothetical protein [Clostridia bacterium]MBR0351416.1 hypothetical protein [Clostridia bacterium]